MSEPPLARDERLEAQLKAVPLPDGLLDRLRQIPLEEDEVLDGLVRQVPTPERLLPRLRRLPREPGWSIRLSTWATAASLFVLFGLWQLGWTLSMVASVPVGWAGRASKAAFERTGQLAEPMPLNYLLGAKSGPQESPGQEQFAWEAGVVRLEMVSPSAPGWKITQPDWLARRWGLRKEDFGLARTLAKWPMMASPVSMDAEDLWTVPLPAPRGVDPPLVPGFPWGEYRRWGVHPFVVPAAHPLLCVSEVPLAVSPASFELARTYLSRGMLPPRDAIRTEEFLAAIDYAYPMPRPAEQIRLGIWAGPSLFRGTPFQMIQVGVQAAMLPDGPRAGTSATLVLDCSRSMQWGARWGLIVQALELLQGRLSPKDRIHVVLFQAQAVVVAEDLVGEDLPELIQVLAHQEPAGSTNAAEGLRHGCAVARRYAGQKDRRNRVILLTDGLVAMDQAVTQRVQALLAEAAAEGIVLDVVDLGQERLDDQPEPLLAQLAEQTGGTAYRATHSRQVLWALLESITGRSQRVAADVRLRVRFNPGVVSAYRLLGHESRAMVGLKPARVETDFYSGQSGTALYEVRLAGGGPDDLLLTAELTWRDPRTGQTKSVQQKLLRKQLAGSVLQSPLPLQAAMLAAQTAEVLRESPFAGWIPTVAHPKGVLEAGRQLDSRLLAWPSVQQMLALLEKAVTAKPYRPTGLR